MLRRILLLSFIIFSCVTSTFGEVFTVTSNADSGPGTLREALTKAAAHGNTERDYINFNLPDLSEAGRTIILKRELPKVTSNLIIDGSSQQGLNYGPSDAKIHITVDRLAYTQPTESTGGLILYQISNVELYGLYISGFANLNVNMGSGSAIKAAIILAGCQDVKVGAPGKGNWLNDSNFYIMGASVWELYDNTTQSNITLQSNYFGYEKNGTLNYAPDGVSLYGKNITFGGDNINEGNHIGSIVRTGGLENINIINNNIGFNLDGTPIVNIFPNIECSGSKKVIIRNNNCGYLYILLAGDTDFKVYANKETGNYVSVLPAIEMRNCTDGIIGSENLDQINVLNASKDITSTISNSDSKNIQILKNSIICSGYAYRTGFDSAHPYELPQIKVLINNDTEYSGTAPPNSIVYIYQDNTDCEVCSPVSFYTKVTTDTDGKWKITGNFKDKRWISNTLYNQNSSEFTQPNLSSDYFDQFVSNPTCERANGSIQLLKLKHVLKVIWYDANDNVVGEGEKISNLLPGQYYAKCFNGNCSIKTPFYYLYNVQSEIIDTYVKKQDPSCGLQNGSITNLIVTNGAGNPLTYVWYNQNNQKIATTYDLKDVSAGSYTFIATDNINNCTTTYGPITLTNTTGPNISETDKKITATPCGQSTGSITNLTITGTGTLKYSWKNEQDQEVGTSADLTNQPAGKYTLQVIDETNCGPIYSSPFEITETNGITINDVQKVITSATCSNANGSITGIQVLGATSYQWYNSNNQLVGSSANLNGVPPGIYHLVASNTTCSKTSIEYTVEQRASTESYASTKSSVDATCGESNGSITVIFTQDQPAAVRWENAAHETLGYNTTLEHIKGGSYQLFITDENGCEHKYLQPYSIIDVPPIEIAANTEIITNDQCAQKQGSIKGISFTGGKSPYTYQWFTATHTAISNQLNLLNVPAGVYELHISDATDCPPVVQPYTISNRSESITPPIIPDVQICAPGSALLLVDNPASGYSYRLYDSRTATNPIDEQTNGRLRITTKTTRSFYVSQLIGSCESPRSEVHVNVGLSGLDIANTFSPNGDGVNDLWILKGIENYPAALVQIFNRYGEKVFESRGYSLPFSGNMNGKTLPAGVYYYIINLNMACNLISGSLTIIR